MYLNCFTKGIATMKLALAQISMTSNMQENLEKSLLFCDQADGTDLLFSQRFSFLHFFLSMKKGTLTDIVFSLILWKSQN